MAAVGMNGKWAALIAAISVALTGCPDPSGTDGGTGGGVAGGTGGGTAGGGTTGTGGGAGGTGGGGTAGGGGGGGGGAPAFVDLDVVAARFNEDGGLDTTFGDGGVVRLDLGTANPDGGFRDLVWSMAKDGTDRLVLFTSAQAPGARRDPDRVAVRLTADGQLDTSFGGTGQVRFDWNGYPDNTRNGVVQPDGKIVWAGFTPIPSVAPDGGTTAQNVPVVIRLDSNGAFDPTFGDGGVAVPVPADFRRTDGGAAGMLEAYTIARTSSSQYVTTGYGRLAPAGQVDVISTRLSETGVLDTSWNSNLGYHLLDLVGHDDRGRNLVMLPDGRPLVTGSGIPLSANVLDALIMIFTPGGQLDTTFNGGTGYKLYNFMGTDEAFFGAAVSPNGMQVAAAGWSGGGTNANEDATLLLMPLMGGAPAEFAQKVPMSPTAHDRFWSVTFDANSRAVAAGFVNVGGDTRIAVARFTPQGVFDTSFGGTGFVTLNVSVGRADETARAVVVQSSGKIVVAGIAEH